MVDKQQQAPVIQQFFQGEVHTISEQWQRWFMRLKEKDDIQTEITSTDNKVVRVDGTKNIQGSAVEIDDNGNIDAGTAELITGSINREAGSLTIEIAGVAKITISAGQVQIQAELSIVDFDIVLGTTTGTKIGTAAAQKLGLYGTTPIIQPTTGVAEATFTQNGGNAVNDDSTFDGYTVKQVVKALRNIGVLT